MSKHSFKVGDSVVRTSDGLFGTVDGFQVGEKVDVSGRIVDAKDLELTSPTEQLSRVYGFRSRGTPVSRERVVEALWSVVALFNHAERVAVDCGALDIQDSIQDLAEMTYELADRIEQENNV